MIGAQVYPASPIKRRRATADEMEKGTKQAREQERFESDIIALAERWQA